VSSFPNPFTSTTFVDGEDIDNTKLFGRVLSWLNDFLTFVLGLGAGYSDDDSSSTGPTLTNTAQFYGVNASNTNPAATVTVTVPTGGRRYRIDVMANVNAATANGRYYLMPGYNTGSTISATPITIGRPCAFTCPTTSSYGQSNFGTVFLTAGQYTFYPAVQRVAGGAAGDVVTSNTVLVTDIGAV
jgi:hypothetical protein